MDKAVIPMVVKRTSKKAKAGIAPELQVIFEEERTTVFTQDDGDSKAEFQHRKWQAIHRHLVENTFHVSETLPRSEQWRRVLTHMKQTVGDPDMIDWLLQQINIAENIANGIRDMRPRKNGQCYDVFMEWVANRKRRSHAVLQWNRGQRIPDFPTFVDRTKLNDIF